MKKKSTVVAPMKVFLPSYKEQDALVQQFGSILVGRQKEAKRQVAAGVSQQILVSMPRGFS